MSGKKHKYQAIILITYYRGFKLVSPYESDYITQTV